MALLTLGDSHALFCYAGVAGARIYWRGPVTMHRVARDGIGSVTPGNFRPSKSDVVVLSFGEIDCRAHIPKIASDRQTTTRAETLALCDRFERAFVKFERKYPARFAISCVVPPSKEGLLTKFYRSTEECFEDAIAIRDTMNSRLAEMAPLIDFRDSFRSLGGGLLAEVSDGLMHIDSRKSQPIVAALNSAMGTDFVPIEPIWPHPFPMAQPPYISPLRKARRKIKRYVLSSLGLKTYPADTE